MTPVPIQPIRVLPGVAFAKAMVAPSLEGTQGVGAVYRRTSPAARHSLPFRYKGAPFIRVEWPEAKRKSVAARLSLQGTAPVSSIRRPVMRAARIALALLFAGWLLVGTSTAPADEPRPAGRPIDVV